LKRKYFTELPVWIDSRTWLEYVAMRKHIRKTMTPRAIELAIEKLGDLKEEGNDPNRVLEQSIFNSWQGLFPIRESRTQFNGRSNAEDAVAKTIRNLGLVSGRS